MQIVLALFFIYMKKVFRIFIISLLMIFVWPFFLYKKYGNKRYRLENRTIIVANHYSTWDPFYIYMIYGGKKKITFITIKEAKKRFFAGFFTWLFDCIFIDLESNHVLFIRQCMRVLKNDGILCIFPEGYYNPRKYGFLDFKPSFVFLSTKAKANVLPLYIYPESTIFRRSKIYIGDVIPWEKLNEYDDFDCAAMYVQSKVMDYSFLV